MAASRIVFLMYHELELAGRKLCQSEPGYVRYILPLDTFRSQMAWMKKSGWRGLNVSEALRYPAEPSVCITFDDGCETDLIAAAPVLREFGFNATFYLTAGFLGTPGYLNASQVRDLDAQGFQIGCHSMTHPYLSDLTEPELKREVVDAKLQIEQIVGHANRTLLLSRRTLRSAHAPDGAPRRVRNRCQQRVSCELFQHQPLRTRARSHAARPHDRAIRRHLPRPRVVEEAPSASSPPQRAAPAWKSRLRSPARTSCWGTRR